MLPSVWYLLISVGVHQLTGPGPNRAELFQYWQSSFLLLLGNSGLQVCTAHLRVTLPGSHHPEVWKSKGSGLRPGEGSEALTPEEPNTQQSRQMRLNARFLKIKINAKEKKKKPTQEEQNTSISNKDRITITDFFSWPQASVCLSTAQGRSRSLVILSRAERLLDTQAPTPLKIPACVTPGKLSNLSETQFHHLWAVKGWRKWNVWNSGFQ